MSRFVQSLFIAAAMLTTAPAFAYGETPNAVTVCADDLDLSNARDAQRMLTRLERAADSVCGRSIATTYHGQFGAYRSCRAATLATAVNRLGAEQVSAVYAARYGAPEIQLANVE